MNKKYLKTGIALLVLAAAALGLEVYTLLDSTDDWVPITAVMRALPTFAVAGVSLLIGVLMGHFWWRD